MQTHPVETVAHALHITPRALRKRIKKGKVKAIRIGKRWEIPEDEFNRLISEARGVTFTEKEAEEEAEEDIADLQPFLERLTENVNTVPLKRLIKLFFILRTSRELREILRQRCQKKRKESTILSMMDQLKPGEVARILGVHRNTAREYLEAARSIATILFL